MNIKRISDIVNLSYGSPQNIIHENLGYWKMAVGWIPKMMTNEQKANQMTIRQQLKRQLQLSNIKTTGKVMGALNRMDSTYFEEQFLQVLNKRFIVIL